MAINKKLLIFAGTVVFIILISGASFFKASKKFAWEHGEEKASGEVKKSGLGWDGKAADNDGFNDPNGPFYHKIYKAVSENGIDFIKTGGVVFDKASVPDVVRMPDGRIFMVAVDGARRSRSMFMVAASKDNGETWQAGSLQLEAPDMKEPKADPEIILLPDGRLRLFYIVFPKKMPALDANGKPLPLEELVKIKSAVSVDGINYIEEDGVRYQSDKELITDPDVVKIKNKWFMYVSKGMENVALSSSDGLNFAPEKSIRTNGAISKTVEIENGKFRQYYCHNGISSAVTTDGLNWTNEGVRLAEDPGKIFCDPAPVKVDNKWLLFYKVQDIPGAGSNRPKE